MMRPEHYIAKSLSVYFSGNSLPSDLSEFIRKIYRKGTPSFTKGKPFYTPSGLQVANNFRRVITTDYGAFLELEPSDINLENLIAAKQHDGKQQYHKLYVDREGEVKFYYQLSPVVWGEFVKGNIYVSVFDVIQYNSDEISAEQNYKSVKFELPNEIKNIMNK